MSKTVSAKTPPARGRLVVLFDAAHGEDAGNADWVVDEPGARFPEPSAPTSADDWSGAYSAFGYALYKTGRFEVQTLPRGAGIRDLSFARVLVIPEPNTLLQASEKDVLWAFVRGGGGLLLLANHDGSDRNGDGVDGADAADDILAAAPEVGIRVNQVDIKREDPTASLGDHLILAGPAGSVSALTFFDATTLRVSAPAIELVRRAQVAEVLAAAAEVGRGRIVVVGDSAGADDGKGHAGNQLFDGWSDYDNARFYENCVSWLAEEY